MSEETRGDRPASAQGGNASPGSVCSSGAQNACKMTSFPGRLASRCMIVASTFRGGGELLAGRRALSLSGGVG
jgi:hypothetical protein